MEKAEEGAGKQRHAEEQDVAVADALLNIGSLRSVAGEGNVGMSPPMPPAPPAPPPALPLLLPSQSQGPMAPMGQKASSPLPMPDMPSMSSCLSAAAFGTLASRPSVVVAAASPGPLQRSSRAMEWISLENEVRSLSQDFQASLMQVLQKAFDQPGAPAAAEAAAAPLAGARVSRPSLSLPILAASNSISPAPVPVPGRTPVTLDVSEGSNLCSSSGQDDADDVDLTSKDLKKKEKGDGEEDGVAFPKSLSRAPPSSPPLAGTASAGFDDLQAADFSLKRPGCSSLQLSSAATKSTSSHAPNEGCGGSTGGTDEKQQKLEQQQQQQQHLQGQQHQPQAPAKDGDVKPPPIKDLSLILKSVSIKRCNTSSAYSSASFAMASPKSAFSRKARENDDRFRKQNSFFDRSSIRSILDTSRLSYKEAAAVRPSHFGSMVSTYSMESQPEYSFFQRLRAAAIWIANHKVFEITMTLVIIFNVIFIAVQADWSVKNPSEDSPTFFWAIDSAFTWLFCVELIFRIYADGVSFCSMSNPMWGRNAFDAFIVVSGIIDEIVRSTQFDMPNVSSMRAVRACRLVRIVRILRVARAFHDLRIMVNGILMSIRSLLWASVLLGLMGFVFGICVMEFVSTELTSLEAKIDNAGSSVDPSVVDFKGDLEDQWGSLILTMYTLYQAISGGVDWSTCAATLIKISPAFGVMFCLYVSVASCCVLNIITGIFVENTKAMLAKDETSVVLETIEKRKQWVEEVKTLWASMSSEDFGNSSTLNEEDFERGMKEPRIQALFRRVGLDVESENCKALFKLLDFDGSGHIDLEEFAAGVQMLHGNAKNIDMARLRHSVAAIRSQVDGVYDVLSDLVVSITGQEREESECPLTARSRTVPGVRQRVWQPPGSPKAFVKSWPSEKSTGEAPTQVASGSHRAEVRSPKSPIRQWPSEHSGSHRKARARLPDLDLSEGAETTVHTPQHPSTLNEPLSPELR